MSHFTIEQDWITHAGFRAVVLMNNVSGTRCGYVGVPSEHPLYGVEYNEPNNKLRPVGEDEPVGKRGAIPLFIVALSTDKSRAMAPDVVFDVHGGLTYSRTNDNYPVQSNLHWFGFDCNHCDDAPSEEFIASKPEKDRWLYETRNGIHRTLDYCIAECESLAQQMIDRVVQPLDIITQV